MPIPAGVKNFRAHKVQHPHQQWVDPAKTEVANEKALKNKTKSVVDICNEQGRDAYDVADEQVEFEAYVEEQRKKNGLLPEKEMPSDSKKEEKDSELKSQIYDLTEKLEALLDKVA